MEFSERQIEIINAAIKLISEKGIQNFTTKNLAAVIGFSEPALYRHFKNKTAILVSVLQLLKKSMHGGMKTIVYSDLKGSEKLEKILKFQFSHFSQNPSIVMVLFAETSFQNDEELSEIVLDILNSMKNKLTNIIKSGQVDGSIRKDISAEHLASIFLGGIRYTILRWRLNNFNSDLIKESEELAQTYKKLMQ